MKQPPHMLAHPHALSAEQAVAELASHPRGLAAAAAAERLALLGPNTLPHGQAVSFSGVFLSQFKSPLIYVLLLAALLSLALQAWSDAGFIFAVLLINAAIGSFQEYSAERAAQALHGLVSPKARVLRDDDTLEVDSSTLVPGDVVLLDSGTKIPADLRLLDSHNLTVDESLLTGESVATDKSHCEPLPADTALAERCNMAFAGTMVNTGRARGLVTATGGRTELGRIASSVLGKPTAKPPLLQRMERFTRRIAIAVAIAALLVAAVQLARGVPLEDIFLLAVALAVSAIPEGLPVAVTVALAVGTARMARRSVIVRKLVAVEALGSCTYIASDKTGTLTVNQLTVRRVQFPDQPPWEVTGEGLIPEGIFLLPQGASMDSHGELLVRLSRAATLANEGVLARRDEEWVGQGDSVDLALLAMAHKAGVTQADCAVDWHPLDNMPYEPERRFAAALHQA